MEIDKSIYVKRLREYQMNYDTDSVYANALLEWLNSDKKEYLLFRNNVLFDESYMHIIS